MPIQVSPSARQVIERHGGLAAWMTAVRFTAAGNE